MSTPALTVPPDSQQTLVLRGLYQRYKALAISAGASLAAQRHPLEMLGSVNELEGDCARAGADGSASAQLAAAFDACREAARLLTVMVAEAQRGRQTPSPRAIGAVRESHRRLRRLVWQFCECEYVPCAAHRDLPAARQADGRLKGIGDD